MLNTGFPKYMSKEGQQGNARHYLRRSHFVGRNLSILIIFTLSSVLQPIGLPLPASSLASKNDAATGGHLGWPTAPAIDLRSAANAHVTPIGSYKTSIPIDLPLAPGAPTLSFTYDSAMGLGIAGIGWDLSVGWPTLIARDTRYGTPTWDYSSPWVWGGAALVQEPCTPAGDCSYRTAPDFFQSLELTKSNPLPLRPSHCLQGFRLLTKRFIMMVPNIQPPQLEQRLTFLLIFLKVFAIQTVI